ncbi:hypothetical protein CZ814_00044 [Photobacterium toruni]|uniref:Uncharacterized protein n=1 Tax=Photobacterium toruni TaxID=1935446 RepID=A0A1T4JTF7_9GAMM|nr:hypothetical protein CZ814_00044 [Photobacterium toruni]
MAKITRVGVDLKTFTIKNPPIIGYPTTGGHFTYNLELLSLLY